MGILKTLLSGADDDPELESESPEIEKRLATEAALDRLIAARAADSERRAGQDRRQGGSLAEGMPERRGDQDRRSAPRGIFRPAGFGRRNISSD